MYQTCFADSIRCTTGLEFDQIDTILASALLVEAAVQGIQGSNKPFCPREGSGGAGCWLNRRARGICKKSFQVFETTKPDMPPLCLYAPFFMAHMHRMATMNILPS